MASKSSPKPVPAPQSSPTASASSPTTSPRRRHQFHVPAALDHALTAAFLLSSAFVFYFLAVTDQQSLKWLLGLIVLSAIGIELSKAIIGRFGLWISRTLLRGAPFNDPLGRNKVNAGKFRDQSWQLVVHASMAILELNILAKENWWQDPAQCWIPAPHTQDHSFGLRILYLTQLSVWMYTAFAHRFLEPRKKDYVVMFVHHVATIILVGVSYAVGFVRIGLLVLLVHDISDVPIDLMKMVNFLKLEDRAGLFLTEIGYVSTMLGWVYFRLYQFPFRVINSATYDSHRILCGLDASLCGRPFAAMPHSLFPPGVPFWLLTNGMLYLLQALHIYWFFLLARIGLRIIFAGPHQAGRENYEGDSDDEKRE